MDKNIWWSDSLPESEVISQKKKFKSHIKYGGAFVIILIMVIFSSIAVVIASTSQDPKMYRIGPERAVMYPAPIADVLHSCGDIFLFYPERKNYGIVPDSVLYSESGIIPTVPTKIPSYGYMSPKPYSPDKRIYNPGDKNLPSSIQMMRGMWEGYYFAWYDPEKASPSQINYLKQLTNKYLKLVVLPWTDDENLPMGRAFAFATWNVSQSCQSIEEGTVESFLKLTDPKKRNMKDPPMAPLVRDNRLNVIMRYSTQMFPDDVKIDKNWGK